MKKLTKKVASVLFAVLASTVLFSCKKEQKTTVIGYRTGSLCAIPMHIAILNGYFEKEFAAIGQKVELLHQTGAGGVTADLVSAGKVDAGFDLISSQLKNMESGLPIVFAAGVHTGCTRYFVKGDSPITSPAGLKNKKIGVFDLADSSVMNLRRKLNDLGINASLDSDEVKFVKYEMTTLGQVLDRGEVDAIALHEPMATKIQAQYGLKEILNTGTDPKFEHEYCCQVFVTEDLLERNPEAVRAFVRAVEKAAAFVKTVPEQAVKIQLDNNFTTGTVEGNTAILKTLDYTPSYEWGRQTFINAATELSAIGVLKNVNVDDFVKKGYVAINGIPEGYTYDPKTDTFTEIK